MTAISLKSSIELKNMNKNHLINFYCNTSKLKEGKLKESNLRKINLYSINIM